MIKKNGIIIANVKGSITIRIDDETIKVTTVNKDFVIAMVESKNEFEKTEKGIE